LSRLPGWILLQNSRWGLCSNPELGCKQALLMAAHTRHVTAPSANGGPQIENFDDRKAGVRLADALVYFYLYSLAHAANNT